MYRHPVQETVGELNYRYRTETQAEAQIARQELYNLHCRGRVQHERNVEAQHWEHRKYVLYEQRTGERHPDRPIPGKPSI